MWRLSELDDLTENLLLAGQPVSPGSYRNVETGMCLEFEQDGQLPPSFDGRVACYVPISRVGVPPAESLSVEHEHHSNRSG